jgi:hypothetical protein
VKRRAIYVGKGFLSSVDNSFGRLDGHLMAGVRRSGRIKKEIKVLLMGTDTSGHVFSEETCTVVLSRHGAGIVSRHKLAADEILMLRLFGTSAQAEVRLVGKMGEETRGYTYGLAFLNDDLDFWELKFPPPQQWHSDPDSTLECTGCHSRQIVHQSEVEADVYALTQNILRFCQACGTSTVWKQADAVDPTAAQPAHPHEVVVPRVEAVSAQVEVEETGSLLIEEAAPSLPTPSAYQGGFAASELVFGHLEASPQVAVAEKPVSTKTAASEPTPARLPSGILNRRKGVRTRVTYSAWVRHDELGDEVTECDNISKGGFSFRSRKSYPPNCLIQVAVPYSPGWEALFVPACIKHIEPLPGGKIFRYGAAYTDPPKKRRDS